jgi:hypothetical protein
MEPMPTQPGSGVRYRIAYLWIETTVVLLACVLPLIFNSEADVYHLRPGQRPSPFLFHALSSLVQYVGQIALVVFIIWRSNDALSHFGLVPLKIGRDLIFGIVLCAFLRGLYHLLWWSLRYTLSRDNYLWLIHTSPGELYVPPSGVREFCLLALMCLISGFAQELVMRAYLIPRFEELFDSTSLAILFSTMLFIFYHGYQGIQGVIWITLFGVIQAIVFSIFRRVAPISLAHAINNFIALSRMFGF